MNDNRKLRLSHGRSPSSQQHWMRASETSKSPFSSISVSLASEWSCNIYLEGRQSGFNDAGELLPEQGGTNEDVVDKMYKDLKEHGQGKEKNLNICECSGFLPL